MVAALGVMLGVLIALMVHSTNPARNREPDRAESPLSSVSFVGANACGGCHEHELKLWKGSHHQLAMQPATDSTVLGDFSGVSLAHGRVVSRFFRVGSKFAVRTDGPDDALHDYEIKYTFGVSPLQQYLIEFPGGRLQALDITWDSRPRAQGGQRWFHLYPDKKMVARDPLHWTGPNHNWNFMCADCHSTNLRKNYDPQTRTFNTSYAEINVACEACHGPGTKHVAWAKSQRDWKQKNGNKGLLIALDDRRDVTWTFDSATGAARRSSPRSSEREIQMCARCHSRRELLHEDYVHGQPVEDDYRVALLDENLYFPDGQIEDEVYEYGSFIQSRMFDDGVTCSDCHEPHGPQATTSACSAIPRSTIRRRITFIEPGRAGPNASNVICRHGPTWWSMSGGITACGSRGPTFRLSSGHRTLVTIATPAKQPNGQRPPSKNGTGRPPKGFNDLAKHCMRARSMRRAHANRSNN